eukprot:gene9588-1790_t
MSAMEKVLKSNSTFSHKDSLRNISEHLKSIWKRNMKPEESQIYQTLNFFIEKGNLEIWQNEIIQTFEVFVKACHYTKNYQQIIDELMKVHKKGKLFHTSPLKILLTKKDVFLDFVELFYKPEEELLYNVKIDVYLLLDLEKCKIGEFYKVFNRTTRFSVERDEIKIKLEKKYKLQEL